MSIAEPQSAEALVYNLQSNPAGDLVAAGAENGSIILYKVEKENTVPVQKLAHGTSAIFSIVFTDERLIAATYDGHLLVWRQGPSEYVFESDISVFQGCINSIAKYKGDIMCGCSDGRLRRVAMTGETKMECVAHRHGVTAVTVHKEHILTSGMDGLIKIWKESDLSLLLEIKENKKPVRDCKVCKNEYGSFIFATCADDGQLMIFTEEKDAPLKFAIDKHQLGSPCTKLVWTQLGYALAVGYGKEEVKVFTPAGPTEWKEDSVILA